MTTQFANLVSIIMPAYNSAVYIAESIESVRSQTYVCWELIIVDDGSTDGTSTIVKKYCEIDSRIRYVFQQNSRQGKARNNGISHSHGAYIAFLDSDDLWFPEKLTLQLQFIESNNVDLVFSECFIFEKYFDLDEKSDKMHISYGEFKGESAVNLFLSGNQASTLTVLCKRGILEDVGGFTENILIQNAEDYHLWLKLLFKGYTFFGMKKTLGAYRIHSASISGSDKQNLRQVVETKLDLKRMYPQHEQALEKSIRNTIINSLSYFSGLSNEEFFATIDRFLLVSNKSVLRPIFSVLKAFRFRRIALKSAYFTFNYL